MGNGRRRPVPGEEPSLEESLRFAAGWRWIPSLRNVGRRAVVGQPRPSIRFDVVRSQDLVSFTVEGHNIDLVPGRDAHLRPGPEGDAQLVLVFPFQHMGEEAIYEVAAPVPNERDGPDGKPVAEFPAQLSDYTDEMMARNIKPPHPLGEAAVHMPPIKARPARGSRLVFEVPEGTVIPFTVEGILKALGRLPMRVHRLAKPAPAILVDLSDWRTYRLFGERVARLDQHGTLRIERAVDAAYPDLTARGRLVALARDGRRLRTRLAGGGMYEGLGGTATIIIGGHTYEMPGVGGYAVVDIPDIPIELPYHSTHSSPPGLMETSIEAPFRLAISPSVHGGWAHAGAPVSAEDAPHRTELWHSRLGVRKTQGEKVSIDEQDTAQRVIRAIWARDRERGLLRDWQTSKNGRVPPHDDIPFKSSLDSADRHMLVRQSSESWLDRDHQPITPKPVNVKRLYLSSLGAWLDLHGDWETDRYTSTYASVPEQAMAAILSWDHVAPMGRDQYVRVVYPGYLYPFGHKATLVKVTERKMKDASPSIAGLYQRKFLVVGEPVKTFSQRDLPFTEVRIEPLKTPTLDDPGNSQNTFFFPEIGGRRFEFILHCKDKDGRPSRLVTPLLWVADHCTQWGSINDKYNKESVSSPARIVSGDGQHVAFAEARPEGGNAVAPVHGFEFAGEAGEGTSIPKLVRADVDLPAVQGLSPIGPVTIEYASTYLSQGFAKDANAAEVWASVRQAADGSQPKLVFGESEAAASDRAGGFLQPNLAIDMLSRTQGITGKVPAVLDAAQKIQPDDYLASLGTDFLPKLFGLVPLGELLQALGLDELPSVVSETLDRIEGLLADVARAKALLNDAVGTVQSLSASADDQALRLETRAYEAVGHAQSRLQGLAHDVAQEIQDQAQGMLDAAIAERDRILAQAQDLRDRATETVTKVETLAQQVENAATQLMAWIENPSDLFDLADRLLSDVKETVDDALDELDAEDNPLQMLRDVADELTKVAPDLPPGLGKRFTDLASVLQTILKVGEIAELVNDIVRFVEQFSASDLETSFRYEWKPKLQSWPSDDPILKVKEDSLTLAVEGRVSGKGSASLSVLAELREFVLNLLPVETLVRFRFKYLSFSAGSRGKTEVDVVLEDIEFVGILSFIEVLKDLIPFDGFSDPPYLDVTAQGLTAGYTLELPNVAIGVFSLTNISLGADVRVPFLGDAVTVGFNFCTRESPFALTVSFIGGGGWFLLRLSPDGLDVLELGLEAGASLSVDFGVASGSVSAMLGIYMRLEGEKGSLTGYFRLRGEVEVLCIISASIELYLGLEYQFDTGKMIGRASLTVKVEVFFFSASVTIECERQFAGSNGDPSFADVMILSDGSTEPWSTYCHAFAGE